MASPEYGLPRPSTWPCPHCRLLHLWTPSFVTSPTIYYPWILFLGHTNTGCILIQASSTPRMYPHLGFIPTQAVSSSRLHLHLSCILNQPPSFHGCIFTQVSSSCCISSHLSSTPARRLHTSQPRLLPPDTHLPPRHPHITHTEIHLF